MLVNSMQGMQDGNIYKLLKQQTPDVRCFFRFTGFLRSINLGPGIKEDYM